MQTPVVLAVFANAKDRYLESLKLESRNLDQTLSLKDDLGVIKFYREESVETEEVLAALERFEDRLCIFHFGGHASGKALEFEDGGGYAKGIATLLSRQSKLKLVFLNGCSTLDQVELLLKLGIKAVIATNTEVEDRKALDFASLFYQKLANGGTLQRAFDFASDGLKTKYQDHFGGSILPFDMQRGVISRKGNNSNSIAWDLHYNKENSSVLQWSLPEMEPDIPDISLDFEANETLLLLKDRILEITEGLNTELYRLQDKQSSLFFIAKSFPGNIGSQLAILFSADFSMRELCHSRLKQIISTYIISCQFIYYLLLAQWTTRKSTANRGFVKGYVVQLLDINQKEFLRFDFITMFQRLVTEIKDRNLIPFVPEFLDLQQELEQKDSFWKACLYLQSIREKLIEQPAEKFKPTIQHMCMDAEGALTRVLSELAFLTQYQLVSVRDIQMLNPWHKDPLYQHKMGQLNIDWNKELNLFREPKSYSSFLENGSVLLLKNIDEIGSYLNLSPFYVDKIAFGKPSSRSRLIDLYTYSYKKQPLDGEIYEFYYLKCTHGIFPAIERNKDQFHTGYRIKGKSWNSFTDDLLEQEISKNEFPFDILKEQFVAIASH